MLAIRYSGLFLLAACLFLQGCVSFSLNKTGIEFIENKEVINEFNVWREYKETMSAKLEELKGHMTYDEAIKEFGEPVNDRETDLVKGAAWHQGAGWIFNWDLFIPKGSKVTQKDVTMALGFTKDGILRDFELGRASKPQSSFGATTEHAAQIASLYLAMHYVVVPALNRVVDRLTEKIEGFLPRAETAVTNGIKNGIDGAQINGGVNVLNGGAVSLPSPIGTVTIPNITVPFSGVISAP